MILRRAMVRATNELINHRFAQARLCTYMHAINACCASAWARGAIVSDAHAQRAQTHTHVLGDRRVAVINVALLAICHATYAGIYKTISF